MQFRCTANLLIRYSSAMTTGGIFFFAGSFVLEYLHPFYQCSIFVQTFPSASFHGLLFPAFLFPLLFCVFHAFYSFFVSFIDIL